MQVLPISVSVPVMKKPWSGFETDTLMSINQDNWNRFSAATARPRLCDDSAARRLASGSGQSHGGRCTHPEGWLDRAMKAPRPRSTFRRARCQQAHFPFASAMASTAAERHMCDAEDSGNPPGPPVPRRLFH